MGIASLVLAVLSIILGVVTAIVNLRRLREDRLWLESIRDSNQNENKDADRVERLDVDWEYFGPEDIFAGQIWREHEMTTVEKSNHIFRQRTEYEQKIHAEYRRALKRAALLEQNGVESVILHFSEKTGTLDANHRNGEDCRIVGGIRAGTGLCNRRAFAVLR